ncbi:GFA family protein [Conexibacter sp. JD483]|uniref:GFA family protein n=2 Tax=Conexibacter TaxID=191494 RepID=UPI002723A978|nr:GFA family protein [Conexibacter sp. JD483]MDO8187016.1 GFA family protein [Conexibacter sp. CPCC 205706]MDR9371598.1 GFA family protein [Conexibacter sp. JD483]
MTGECNCGAVRSEVRAPFSEAGYCHCGRCQRRTGTAASPAGVVAASAFAIVSGAEQVRSWQPEGGKAKAFCGGCGSHLFAGDPATDSIVAVRLGAVDGDPGIRPRWHQWVSSAPAWEALADDGLPRYDGPRPS